MDQRLQNILNKMAKDNERYMHVFLSLSHKQKNDLEQYLNAFEGKLFDIKDNSKVTSPVVFLNAYQVHIMLSQTITSDPKEVYRKLIDDAGRQVLFNTTKNNFENFESLIKSSMSEIEYEMYKNRSPNPLVCEPKLDSYALYVAHNISPFFTISSN